MIYKASLDIKSILITLCSTVIIFGIIFKLIQRIFALKHDQKTVLFPTTICIFLSLVFLFSYLFSISYYSVDSKYLIIHRPIGDLKFAKSEISKAIATDSIELGEGFRKFGVGGLFGYYGNYHFSKYGNVDLYTTNKKNRILINFSNGKKIIISPNDPLILNNLLNQKNSTSANRREPQ